MQYKNIIFDLGGVLIDWDPRYLYRKIFDTEFEIEYFLEHICDGEWNEQQDAGRGLVVATREKILEFPLYSSEIKAFYGRWTEMLGGPIHDTVDVLESIKSSQKYGVFALTNWSAETFPEALSRYDFLQWFEYILVSGQESLKKPDPLIYQLALERYGIEKESSIFIDDSKRNVNAAIDFGIHSIHFQNPEQLKVDLNQLGITF